MTRMTRTLLATAALTATACGAAWRGAPERHYQGTGVENVGSATVVTAEELHDADGSVLRAIMGKVPNMKVSFTDMGRCPAIALRSAEDIHGNDFPGVYVDGTHASDTCILESLQARDVERVEIYPMGFTHRHGYGRNNGGLILVFTRRT